MNTLHMAVRCRLWFLILAGVAFTGSAVAQNGELKIGFVDEEALLSQSPQAQAVLQMLQDEFAPRQRDLQALQTELQEKQETYQRDREVMGADERNNLERELRDGARDLERDQQEFQEDLNLRRNELLAGAYRGVAEQITTFAEERGYDLILQNAVYVGDAINITNELVSYLNARVASPSTSGQ